MPAKPLTATTSREIEEIGGTETDAPSRLGHVDFYSAVLEMTLSARLFK